ncbi:MAG: hypothetical protein HDT30_13065 [Clostridiales bacterium]|nr:hypothetical protein [Clostridiales bacterium]
MEGNSVLLIIVGIIIIFISYVISEKIIEKNTTGQGEFSFDQSIFDKIWKEKEAKFREDMDKIIQERADETTNYVEDKLAHISNEKIMAVSEYSDQILENIDKNHKEVVFLYDMLNEKENEMKDFVQEIDKSKVVLEEIAHKELEKQKMIQHKRIQKELEEQKRKKDEKERQKDDLMMSGYISNKTVENTELEEKEIITPLEQEEVKEEKSVFERMEGVVEESLSEEKIKEPKQVELPMVEENNNQVILELYNEGKTIMEIAKLLGKGQGEVKLVIDLFQGNTN